MADCKGWPLLLVQWENCRRENLHGILRRDAAQPVVARNLPASVALVGPAAMSSRVESCLEKERPRPSFARVKWVRMTCLFPRQAHDCCAIRIPVPLCVEP